MRHPLSLCHLSMLEATPLELVDAALDADFDYVGLRIVSPDDGTEFQQMVTDTALRRRVKDRTRDLRGGVWDVEAFWLRPETRVEELRPALDAAEDLGARQVLVVGADYDRSRLTRNLGLFAEFAAGAGLSLALEPITYTAVPDIEDGWNLIRSVGIENIALLVDSLQFFRSDFTVSDMRSIPEDRLQYAQIADGPAHAPMGIDALRQEAREARRVPGEGDFDLVDWTRALPEGIPIGAEVPATRLRGEPPRQVASILKKSIAQILDRAES